MNLNEFKNNLARELHGMTPAEAIEQGICIDCKYLAAPQCHNDVDRAEYLISGICGECFDHIFTEEEDYGALGEFKEDYEDGYYTDEF